MLNEVMGAVRRQVVRRAADAATLILGAAGIEFRRVRIDAETADVLGKMVALAADGEGAERLLRPELCSLSERLRCSRAMTAFGVPMQGEAGPMPTAERVVVGCEFVEQLVRTLAMIEGWVNEDPPEPISYSPDSKRAALKGYNAAREHVRALLPKLPKVEVEGC